MARLKKFKLGGLDLKSNDLTRDPLRASDLRNVTKTQKGDIDKRSGYESVEVALFELEESLYYKTEDVDIFISSDGHLYKEYLGARQDCSIATLFPNVGLLVKNRVIYDEYLSNIYITTIDGESDVIKYDGSNAYLAGMPSPTLGDASDNTIDSSISPTGTGYFYRFFYSHLDLNGNVTYGPYIQLKSSSATPTISVSTMKTGNGYGDFNDKYFTIAPNTSQIISLANQTINIVDTNYDVGDKLLLSTFQYGGVSVGGGWSFNGGDIAGNAFRSFVITDITAGVITIDMTGIIGGSDYYQLRNLDLINIKNADSRTRLHVFRSVSETFGYIDVSTESFFGRGQVIENQLNTSSIITLSPNDYSIPLEDLYNEDGQKLRPPKCKVLCAYGDQLVYGNIMGVWDQENNFTQYNNDDILTYSDFGIADNGENHSANLQRIGESYDGSITGLKRCNDLLFVSKNNSLFALDGILESGGYSLRKIPTNYIGCSSHNSILQVTGGIFFQGNDSIYFTDGVGCKKISDLLDPFFNVIIKERTKSTISRNFNKFLFYMTDGAEEYCLAYDYDYSEWFVWDSLDMSKGLYQKNNGEIFFAKEDSTFKFNNSYSDDGFAIEAEYCSNWEDLGEPAVDKKFKYNRIYNLSPTASSFTMSIQKNWINTDIDTVNVDVPAFSSEQKGHPQRTVNSIRYVFRNSVLDEGMLISAYELEFESNQSIDKGN